MANEFMDNPGMSEAEQFMQAVTLVIYRWADHATRYLMDDPAMLAWMLS